MARALTDSERLLVRRAMDKMDQAEKRYSVTSTGFLSELEQDILMTELGAMDATEKRFVGGYTDAERRMLAFVPEYSELDESELMAAVRCSYYKDYDIGHRDLLGALMGLGIERETVGDIIVNKKEKYADIVVKRDILGFILNELSSAGRASLTLKEIPLCELENTERDTVTVTDTVASPRLDAIVATGFGLSRENASALIKSGKVYLDRRQTLAPDKTVTDNATVNAQGFGKFKVSVTGNVSKKGRMFIKIEKYV